MLSSGLSAITRVLIRGKKGFSLAVQRLGLHASTARGMGLIPGWGTKMPHAMQHRQKKKKRGRQKGQIARRGQGDTEAALEWS